MPRYMRPANRQESEKFFAESPMNSSIMINDVNGDYITKREHLEIINRYRDIIYQLQERIGLVQNDVKDLLEETFKDF